MRKLKLALYVSATALTMSAIVFVTSCKKSNNSTATDATTTEYAKDQAVAEKSYDDAQTITETAQASTGSSVNFRTTGMNATVVRDTNLSTGMVTDTIKFGNANVTCHDYRTRRGDIIITYPLGKWDSVGATRTITFYNYYQDDNAVTGTKTVTYEGLNTAGQPYFNISINGTVTYPNGKTITTTWTRTRTWIAGYTTGAPVWNTNVVISVFGTGKMTSSAGRVVDINIVQNTPLVFAYGCQWIESGTISYTLESDKRTRSLNYGDTPNCDDQAVLTLADGKTIAITLP